mgnify:CR=1 FL=1
MINRIFRYLNNLWVRRSSESLLNFYRKKGCKIGKGTVAFYPRDLVIDYSRPSLIEIGSNVFLHKGVTLLTHDFASWTLLRTYGEFFPSSGKIIIGNNVWFGYNCTVLKGVTIGNNCIIGIGSIVTKDIPDNTVAIGAPAKVVCSLDEYLIKRKREYMQESITYARSIKDRFGREPVITDFTAEDYICFVDGSNHHEYPMIQFDTIFKDGYFEKWKINHKAPYNGFDEFMSAVKGGENE